MAARAQYDLETDKLGLPSIPLHRTISSKAAKVPLTVSVLIGLAIVVFTIRLSMILRQSRPSPKSGDMPSHLMIVLGSGGHTAEMLSILRSLDARRYTHRTYVVSSGDHFSTSLAENFEIKLSLREQKFSWQKTSSRIVTVPRARKIHQSLLTTPWSCLVCLFACLRVLSLPWSRPASASSKDEQLMLGKKVHLIGPPDAIITNGPATGVIVVLASYILRFFAVSGSRDKLRTIYIESWARVRRLSLSGKIMLRLADRFIVQWEVLKPATKGRGEYLGVLVE